MIYMKWGCLILKKDKQSEFIYFATDDTFDESKVEMPSETEEQKNDVRNSKKNF